MLKIAEAKGAGASKQKQSMVEKLLVSAKGEETRYLVRTLGQNLRVGAVRTSILTALARAVVLTPNTGIKASADTSFDTLPSPQTPSKPSFSKSKEKQKAVDSTREELNHRFAAAEAIIKKIYVQHPNYDHIAAALLEVGLDSLADKLPLTLGKYETPICSLCRLTIARCIGIPLLPTLGSPTRSLDEIYERLGELPFSAEFKYDGQRAQIHARRGEYSQPYVKIFSRHLEEMTDKASSSRSSARALIPWQF